jgi:hypothetical protein
MADFEQQAASIYDFDQDETWRAAMEFATAAAEEAGCGSRYRAGDPAVLPTGASTSIGSAAAATASKIAKPSSAG